MIRIGSSCALSPEMAIGYTVEARILTDGSAKWKETSKYAIDNKQYLIVCPCVNDGMGKTQMPTDAAWQILIHNTCQYVKSIGGNKDNCHVSIVNEPTKFFSSKQDYVHFVNLAYPIIKSYGFIVGAGNMEFVTSAMLGDWYGYMCANAQFDILDIHIQDSCDSEVKTKQYTDYALNLATTYKKRLNCTEAFCTRWDIRTAGGWSKLLMQLSNAERVGCENFCNVFNNLDKAVFKVNTDNWEKLSFKVNGIINSNYWGHWKILMDTKHPIPNIKERSVEGMIIRTIGYKDTDKKSGYSVSLCNELLFNLGYVDEITSTYTPKTKQGLIDFVTNLKANNPEDLAIQDLTADGRCGRMTFRYLVSEQPLGKEDYQFAFEVIMSPINTEGGGV